MPEKEEGEPTLVCPNCGALVPVGAPNCFICDAEMPKEAPAKAEELRPPEPVPEEIPPSEPVKETVIEVAARTEPEKVEVAAEKAPEVSPPQVIVMKEALPPRGKRSRAEKAKVGIAKPAVELPPVPETKETAPAQPPAPEKTAEEFPPSQEEVVPPPTEEPSTPTVAEVEEVKESPPVPVSGSEEKAAKLKAAFEAGRIPREVYTENLAAMGISVPPEMEPEPAEEETVPVLPSVEEESTPPSLKEEVPVEVSSIEAEAVSEVTPETLAAEAETEEAVREEAQPETLEEVTPAGEAVSKMELVEEVRRSYRGVAVASAGGLMYALTILIFIPMFGNAVSALLLAFGAVLIVAGGNVAARDFASAAAKARRFSCPLCTEELDTSATECTNCGAKFSA